MFESRKLSEEQAGSYESIHNRMTAASLFDLLDARKNVRSRAELQDLAKSFNIDVALLESLARFVNTPSVGEQTSVSGVENGEDRIISQVRLSSLHSDFLLTNSGCQALWADPVLDLDHKQIQ